MQAEKVRIVPSSAWRIVSNPFMGSNNPKIPDGSTRSSCGQKFQVVRQLEAPAAKTLTLILYPGLGNIICYHLGTKEHYTIPLHTTHGSYKIGQVTGTYNGIDPQHLYMQYWNDKISKWRFVSGGIKLSLVNNADENDGWWETARITTSMNPSDWCLYADTGDTNPYYNTAAASPGGAVVNDIVGFGPRIYSTAQEGIFGIDPKTLIEHPTYKTGKLRDIHKYTFNLRPNGKDHEWIPFREAFPVSVNCDTAADVATAYGGSLIVSMGGDTGVTANHDDMVAKNADPNYDALVIRIHGRSTGAKTTLLAHICANQEVVYENGQQLARFHSPGEKATATRTKNYKRAISWRRRW